MSEIIDFNKPYNRDTFLPFLQKFLPHAFRILDQDITPDLTFKPSYIKKINNIGFVDELDLPVYEIYHDSEYDPRVGLSRDSFRIISNFGYSSALCNFISKTSDNYRFSFINIIPEETEKDGKIIKKYSNPRRYSFYLGPDAQIHTPTRFLINNIPIKNINELKEKFSIEVVNENFYKAIAHFFTELAGGKREEGKKLIDAKDGKLRLPGTNDHKKKQEFAVRLIGRIVFCWFLKKKELINDEILSKDAVSKYNKFYHELLERLFFQVLNTRMEERREDLKNSIFNKVPFLNGGLFEPHLNDDYKPDDFTGLSMNGPDIPNNWFRDFFNLLETYNFTVDENTPVDIDLSIDPEMLGRIFENLLAEINPETGKTARKHTGSYYTPRVIVEYMVNESLKQYLLNNTKINEDKIDLLMSYDEESFGYTEQEKKNLELSFEEKNKVIQALHICKILDPACGSGAFPMGILQKILLILGKVDPNSEKWLEEKLKVIDEPILREKIKSDLKWKKNEYIFKLGIIQNCICGVDIQPIAVEISKLRIFLSLIVDEKVDEIKANRGIEELPNLEFKFVCANSLIDLPKEIGETVKFTDSIELINVLQQLRESYFISYGEKKEKIKKEFKIIQGEMFKKTSIFDIASQSALLSEWEPFSDEQSNWFESEWMFGIKEGFNIVIGNPPYGFRNVLSTKEKKYFRKEKKLKFPSGDVAELFIISSLKNLVSNKSILTFIIPKKSLYGESWKNIRKLWLSNRLIFLMDASKAFKKVLLEQVFFSIIKNGNKNIEISIGGLNPNTNQINIFGKFLENDIFSYDFQNAQIYKGLFSKSLLQR